MNTSNIFIPSYARSIFNLILCCCLTACASSGVTTGELYENKPSVDSSKARLIIFRDTFAVGYYQKINIGYDLEFNLTSSTYKEVYVEPGDTRISVKYFPEYYHSNISASFILKKIKLII